MKYSIATIPGDGIGTEVMAAAVKVLEGLAERTGLEFEFRLLYAGDEYKERTGVALPPETVEGVKASDACLFAAVGDTAKEVIIPLRQRLNLYANLRPAKAYPGVPAVNPDVDIMIVRENTEGIYKMIGHRGRPANASYGTPSSTPGKTESPRSPQSTRPTSWTTRTTCSSRRPGTWPGATPASHTRRSSWTPAP